MRIALLSDIHGNRWALEAVLAHAGGQRVDATWNLGDILSGPLDVAGTADVLMALHLPTIAGNHERQLLACAERPGGSSDQYAFAHSEPRHRAWLAALPATLAPRPGVLLCHGTPTSDVLPLLETLEGERLRLASPDEIAPRLSADAPALVACGHTHLARAVQVGDRLIVNPGSVGLPAYDADEPTPHHVDNGSPHASYAIIEQVEAQRWYVELHRVAYDWDAAAALAAANGRPEWAHALRTGFALWPPEA
jgi:predicted phosphodiesterase